MLKITRAGLLSTLQDAGRKGLRHLGIPWSGTFCPTWQMIANALVGNAPDETVIECFEGGLQIQSGSSSIRIAVVGCPVSTIKLDSQGTVKTVLPNRGFTLAPGDLVTISSTGQSRLVVIAIAGIQIDEHLGSTSTYAKALLGGLSGLPLAAGDEIPVDDAKAAQGCRKPELQCAVPAELAYTSNQLRVIPGPQFNAFSTAGKNTFANDEFELSAEADRMGARLTGSTIAHLSPSSRDIVSDAILPGSVQIPGSGQPIVMLNDAHTAGGYPKIATVISCDLPLLGLQRPGSLFRFTLIDVDEAISTRALQRALVKKTIQAFTPCVIEELDSQTLLQNNLIDGVTDGL